MSDYNWPTAYHRDLLPWWRRRWFVPWADGPSTRGWTKRGTENMARRAARWNKDLKAQ